METSIPGNPSIQTARQDFPILDQEIGGFPVTFLDSASSAQKPRQVMEAVRNFEESSYATEVCTGCRRRPPACMRRPARRWPASSAWRTSRR
jgi:hypothetical protein